MSSKSRSHHGINLDEIERHIREASAVPQSSGGRPEDPLAELARIVGGGPVQRREPRIDPPPSGNSFRNLTQAAAPTPAPPPPQTWIPPVRREPTVAPSPTGHGRVRQDPPPAPPRQHSTIEDDIERLLHQPKPAAPPPRRPDELESAMRSLDNLLKTSPPVAPAPAPAVIASPKAQASGAFADWGLRTDSGASAPEPAYAPAQDAPKPAVDFETELARADETPRGNQYEHASAAASDEHWRYAPSDYSNRPADYSEEPAPERAQPRRKRPLIMVAAVLGVAALGVGGALSMRGAGGRVFSGQPPVIVADKGPAKVAPANPGGLEIPDQNKQVLDRSPKTVKPPTKVVNSEEQPIDLREAVRREASAAQANSAQTNSAQTNAAPSAVDASTTVASVQIPPPIVAPTPPAVASDSQPASPFGLAEPRRVRTVAIKPPEPGSGRVEPTTPMPIQAPPVAIAAPPAPTPVPAPAAEPPKPPSPAPVATAATAPAPPPAAAPIVTPPSPPKPKVQGSIAASREAARQATASRPPRPSTDADVADAASATQSSSGPLQITPPSRANARPKPEQRVAAIEPPPPAASPPAVGEIRTGAPSGNFVVQLASEGSDQSARAVIGRMQTRFAELGPYSSSIQRREVNGQMRYRVRFGSMPRETAAALCSALKGKGQDCILQPN